MTNKLEPEYTLEGWALAGWHASDTPAVTFREVEINAGSGHAGTMTLPTLTAPIGREHRADLVESVRKACPGLSAMDGLRAVRILAGVHKDPRRNVGALQTDPRRTDARRAVSDIASDGTAPGTNGAAPDPWGARQHETVAKRSRKGRTTVERKRVGIAPVRGTFDRVPPTDPELASSDMATDAATVASVLLAGVRRINCGAVSFDVQRVADIAYPERVTGVPALLHTDVTSWSTSVDVSEADERPRVTEERSGISGQYRDATWDRFASPEAVYRAQTRHTVRTAKHATRRRLPIGRPRKIDVGPRCRPTNVLRTVCPPFTAPTLVMPLVWELTAPAASTQRRWRGHTLVTRPASRFTRDARNAGTARRKARTVGVIKREPTTEQGWCETATMLAPEERLVVGRVSLTRGKGRNAKYRATDARPDRLTPDGKSARWECRTPEALAKRLA